MKYNFTKSGLPMQTKGCSLQHNSNKDAKVLEFVQKIVSVISLFFKSKNSNQTNTLPREGMKLRLHEYAYAENSLQEYFTDKFLPPVHTSKVESVPDLIPNQDLTMNKLSLINDTTVKEYQLGSHFDEKLKRWKPSLSSPKRSDEYPKNSFFKGFATTILLVLIGVLGVTAQTSVDLSLRKTIDKSLPALNESVKYTLWLKNSGPSVASSIVVQDNFPIEGAVLNNHTGGTNFTYIPSTGTGTWNVASLAVGDSVKLEINATITQRGVFFNTAEVFSIGAGQQDLDSSPNNLKLNEDDIAAACFSVPLHWYPGEEYKISVPAPYKYGSTIKWFNGTTEITPSSTVAVVNADSSLTIKAPGTFTFTTNVANCPAQGCCAVQIVQGPYGSIGDYVWQDTNNDGLQGATAIEPPVAGVKIYLLSASGIKLDSTVTDAQGKYLFDSLTTDSYRIQFIKPIGYDSFTTRNSGTDDTKDNDAGPTGLSQLINIDTSKLPTDTLRNNPNIDAGLKPNFGSIGDYVWNDSNNNGLQDPTETGVSGIIIELYASNAIGLPIGVPLKKDTTDASGKYLFTGLSAGNYVVKVVTASLPSGSQLTVKQDFGTNDAIDSDFNPNTGLSDRIIIDPYDVTKKDLLTFDGGIYSSFGSIGDFVWNDTNNNGLQDSGEAGVAGIKLELYASDALGNPIGAAINTATTNTSGFYTFNNLVKGDYFVRIVTSTLPATYLLSDKVNTGDDTKDSDFNPTSGYSPKISIDPFVAALKDNSTIDGAIYQPVVCAELVVVAVDADICSGDTTSIRGTISGGGTVRWYLTPIGGTPIATTNSGAAFAVFPTTTAVYYGEIANAPVGCANTRQPVAIVVNVRPANPSSMGAVEECIGKTINLNNFIINAVTTPGGSFEWRTTANPRSPLVANPTAVGDGTYYLFEKSGAGCYSNPTLLKVTLKNCDKSIDLSLTKTTDNTTPNVGDNITFTVKVSNTGPDAATAVEVTDELPAGLQFVSSSFFTNNNGVLTSTISNIASSQTITLSYITKVIGSAAMTNFAQIIKANEKDRDSTPNNGKTTKEDDDDKITITPRVVELLADLSLNKTVSNSNPSTGDQITYFVEVKNNGTSNATNVEATDIIPAGLQIISATGGDGIITTGNTVVAKFNQINVSQTATFQIVAKVTATTGTIKNWAEVTKSDQKDPNSTPNNGIDKNENDDDDADITIKQPICNPTTPLIACANPYICLGESVSIESIGCNGTVVWSDGQTGNMITVTPTTNTTYTAQCKINDNCISGKSNPIQIVINVIAPPLITSNSTTNVICNGGNVTLTSNNCTGRILWSTGATTPSITVSPTATTSYTATCGKLTCVSNKSNVITVTVGTPTNAPTIIADNNTVCAGQSVRLTANGCTGTVVWSNGSTGSSITFAPTSTGTYSAVCRVGECSSNASTPITITVGRADSTPTITTTKDAICVGESVTLTASSCTGSLTWSTGATTSSITVSPTSTVTYEATCSVNNCSGKATKVISVTPKPTAPIVTCGKERICSGESLTFNAAGCAGTVTWSTGATGTIMVVNPLVTTTYTAICTVNGCASNPSKDAVITVLNQNPPTITASAETVCGGGTVTLTASNCDGTVLWSNGSTAGTISVTPTVATTYIVRCIVEECSISASKTINIGGSTAPNAPAITITSINPCDGRHTLTASGCTGTLNWNTGATTSSIVVNTGSYSATCSNSCGASVNSNILNVPAILIVPFTIIASNETVCRGGSATLTANNCSSSVLWSTGATTASINVTPTATTTYTVTCNNQCAATATTTINVGNGQTPSAPVISTTKITVCGNETATLTATGCVGSVIWNNGTTGSAINIGAGTYTATCRNSCGVSGNSNAIVIQSGNVTPPTISASATALCETGQVTLTAVGCAGTVIWSNTSTSSSITVSVAITTTFSAACKTATCESGKSNDVLITVGKPNKPTITGNKETVCAGDAVILTATGCEGTTVWSNGLTGSSISVTPSNTTDYTAVCKLPQGGCTSDQSSKITINITAKSEPPVISCTASRICKGDTLTLNALGCNGSILWSTGQTSASINVNPAQTTVYTAICKVGSCESAPSAAATITVGNPIPPVVTCKNTQICGGSSTQIEAAGCTGTVKWSDGQIGAVITVSPISITSYSAICDGGTCQSEKSNVITVQVTGSGLKKPIVRDLVNTCPFVTVDLTTGVSSAATSQGGIFVFRTGTTPGSPAVSNPSTVGTGTYYVFEKAGNGCYSEGAKINVNITTCQTVNPSCVTNPATALAGKDTTVCLSADLFTLQGKIGGAASSAKWTTDGKGSFDNALSLTTKYKYSDEDVVKGSVKFTLTTNDPDDNGSCVAATSSFTVTLNGVSTLPIIAADKSPNICFGDSIVLTATNIGSYKWSTGATTKSITVKTPGRYTVKLISDRGCASLSSSEIVVRLSDAIAAPTVTPITKNNCPSTSVNLTNSVTSRTQSTGGIFEFRTGSSPSSPMLANASAVGSGTYFVIEKSGTGCYSQASPIIVTIDQCNVTADTSKVDVSVQIIGSRVELKVGDPVTYTITVKNNNTVKAATNVNIVNVLPKGVTITSTTPGFTAFGTDSLISVIGSLPAGATRTYTYNAKTTRAGQIINTAKITKLDQIDAILSNNISQWTVQCRECQETCVGMALAADTTRQANGSYNITFRALIESCGNVKLEGVKVTENLATMFPTPTTFTIVQKPTAGVGSKIQTNDSFNGTTDLNLTIPEGSIVEVGKVDTIKFVINIVPNGKEGPFSTNAFVAAIGNTAFGVPQDVSDVSNNGKTIIKESAEPTVVRLYKSPSVGLAKIVLDTTKKANGSFDVTYQLLVKNNGSLTLNEVIVRDTLSKVFKAPATFTVVAAPSKNTSSQLALNSAFNGTTDTRLTLAGSTIAIGKTDTLKFTVNVRPDTLKAFANTAVVSGSSTLTSGTKENVTDLSNAGLNPDAPGSNPTNLNLNSEGGSSIEVPCIGIALYVKDTVRQADSSYNITYKAILKNCGNLNLSNIQVCDTLSRTFTSPAVAKLAVKPTVNAGSLLRVDTSYNGTTKTCMLLNASQLAPNKVDTITWVVNVKLNGNKGPFRNNVVVTATTPSGGLITDVSNAGTNPDPSGNTSTVINFNSLPEALIGISKSANEPKLVAGTTNTYDVTFTFKVKNYGRVAFTGVQIQDNLSVVFGDSVKIDSVKVTADTGLTANNNFTGRGNLINLLVDSLSTLAPNTDKNVTLFTRLTTMSSKANFENQALVIGRYPTNKSENDLSTNGNDPDPDADGTPKNNSLPTPVKLGDGGPIIPSFSTTLGIAKSATLDTMKNSDGSYNLSYKVIVKNYGTRPLTNIQLSDSLSKVFADSARYVLVGKPVLGKNSTLKLNPTFNGDSVVTMLKPDSSSLAAGASDTLTFKLRLLSAKQGDATYANSITGTAKDSTTNVRDISQTGLNPDPDADNNPGNNNLPTVITIKGQTAITDTTNVGKIPQAFSPNSDGKNDLFVIKGINGVDNVEAEIFIYNRWGQLVYQNTDFAKVEGWNGEANNGIVLGDKGVGVPDGTYFICVKAAGFWKNEPQVTFITIAR